MNLATALAKIGRGPEDCEDLSREEAEALFENLLVEPASKAKLAALFMAMRWKGSTMDELAGFKTAIDRHTRRIAKPNAHARLAVIPTYSPRQRQPNLMPALAIRLAQAGVPVIVHGGLGGGDPLPSFSIFELLGHAPVASLAEAKEALELRNLAIVPVELLCPGLAALLELRGELGSRHIGHLVARLIDPLPGRSLRLICSTDTMTLDRLGGVLLETGEEALLMRATDGEPFANPERRPRITWVRDGEAHVLYDEDPYSGQSASFIEDPDDAAAVTRALQDMLEGRRPTPVPLASQLAACIFATGRSRDLAHARAMVAVGYGRHG